MSTPTTQRQYRVNSTQKFTYRDASDGVPARVEGHAAVFNVLSAELYDLGGAREIIKPGAFTRALAELDDCILCVNHDPSLILARTTSGTLTLREDSKGLFFSASLPNTSYSRDLQELLRRGDLSACSFAFSVRDGGMELIDGEPIHVVRSVELSDVSIVCKPAFSQTDVSLRQRFMEQIAELNRNVNVVVDESTNPDESLAAVDSIAHAYRKRKLQLLELE